MITLVYSKRVGVHSLKLHDQIDITHHQSIAVGRKQQLFGRPSSKKRGPVFVISIFSRSHKFTSHERNWDKKSWEILQNFYSWMIVIQKSHLALGNLAKLVFCSILSIKNWIFEKLLGFFCLSYTYERKIWENERKY